MLEGLRNEGSGGRTEEAQEIAEEKAKDMEFTEYESEYEIGRVECIRLC